jgi:hypothetical protein
MLSAMRMAASGIGVQQSFAFGELAAYNPVNHTGQFNLPGHPDPITGQPTVTGFIQLGTPYVGTDGSGAQFPPKIGAQAIIMFLDTRQEFPIFSQWYFNSVELPPFPNGSTAGWVDPKGSSVTTTADGATPGDGVGAVKSTGAGYHQIGTSTGQITIHNSATGEIAHLASSVNIGALKSAMTSVNAVIAQFHLNEFEGNLWSKRLDDLEKFAAAMIAAGVPNASAVLGELATLIHVPVPNGSSVLNAVE